MQSRHVTSRHTKSANFDISREIPVESDFSRQKPEKGNLRLGRNTDVVAIAATAVFSHAVFCLHSKAIVDLIL